MRLDNIGGYKDIDVFVREKLRRFNSSDHDFMNMFELMFSEKENIFYEKSHGHQIEYCTYKEAYIQVGACSEGIRQTIGKTALHDAVIALYMENSLEWIVAFWAILKSGHRPLLLNTRLGDDVLISAMKSADAVAVISNGKRFEPYPTFLYKDLASCGNTEAAFVLTDDGFGSEIMVMSSGTTAMPKICAYSAEEFYSQINDSYQIITECKQIKKHYCGQLKLLTFLPFYHVFGLIAVYIWFAFFSRTFVHLGDFSSSTILNTIRRHNVTHIFAVPLFWNEVYKEAVKAIKARGEDEYQRFCKGISFAEKIGDVPLLGQLFINSAFKEVRENMFGDSIRFMITGGSEIKPEVLSFFNLIGYRLANGYGMTEIGITSVELSGKRRILNGGFVGKPLPSVKYRISQDGILLVSSSSMSKYTVENGVRSEREQWFSTNDLAECVNGHYRIMGRKDDVVIAPNGENLNPIIVENQLACGDEYQICLIGPHSAGGVLPTALVYAGKHMTAEKYKRIHTLVEKKISEQELSLLIGKIVFVDEPLTAPDDIKINRKRLCGKYESGQLGEVTVKREGLGENENDPHFVYVRKLFADIFGKSESEIAGDSDFFLDEGGTSLEYLSMVTKLQADYGVDFPVEQTNTLTTVREIGKYLKEKQ